MAERISGTGHSFGRKVLLNALAQNSLLLVYQPKVDVHSMRVASVEALIRLPPELEGS